jgi:hypothetical protein
VKTNFYAPALVTSIAAGSPDINVKGQTSRDTGVLPGPTGKRVGQTDLFSSLSSLLRVVAFIPRQCQFFGKPGLFSGPPVRLIFK